MSSPIATPNRSPAQIIDGRGLAASYREQIRTSVADIRSRGGVVRLDAVLVDSGDSGARVYAESQARTCGELGIDYRLHKLPAGASFDDIAGRVLLLSSDERVHAIMVHVPLPDGVDAYEVQRRIAPEKDVEGVNPANIGNVVYGRSSLAPCTALATVEMVRSTGIELRGKRAVVIGASDVVGKPIAVLLMREDTTVVSCNKWTDGLKDLARSADVLVAAAGVPGLVTADMVKPGAVVVDVGVNRVVDTAGNKRTVGDVAFDEVLPIAGWLSPVPGGVGPMTVAMLLSNVVASARQQFHAQSDG
ncbi:MAG: bifunctional 5,10-methylenetetrahydrofolate dehydrogenase/5,10-methenyltetrahydrofolate cyclohydrolase [Phycisphaeraceae bacterium]|nr:bifunctional 5,10-methylenetetrahydrofolate dehydrogenase/5,10-methenyltetrahydrofolate cyclohydrolase [Phycisphaerales bacterium]MCB9860869.1 bifunctional 5,10-methylenetetrahydrofolate dehydrogenase/5,10-methenyltetrahydrofolate cyclohydrolase [Phycisphaeraceae bacterium]